MLLLVYYSVDKKLSFFFMMYNIFYKLLNKLLMNYCLLVAVKRLFKFCRGTAIAA